MFEKKCVLFIILVLIFNNSFYSCQCQVINEINLHSKNNDANIALAFSPCNSHCSSSDLYLSILEENPKNQTSLFSISENGLIPIGPSNNSNPQYQFKYHSNLPHGPALFQNADLEKNSSDAVVRFLNELENSNELL